jgi:hypothetical protein
MIGKHGMNVNDSPQSFSRISPSFPTLPALISLTESKKRGSVNNFAIPYV